MIAQVFNFILLVIAVLLLWEYGLRLFCRCFNKKIPEQVFSNDTILDFTSDKPECYAKTDWFDYYSIEVRKIFSKFCWQPFYYWVIGYFKGKYINIDRYGRRLTWSNDISEQSTSKPIRICLFGGSTMWGWGARDDYTIPSLVSKIVSEKCSTKVEVYNYGQLGFVSTQETIFLMQMLKNEAKPDIIIFYDGLNDCYSSFQSNLAGVSYSELERKSAFEESPLRILIRKILRNSYLYKFYLVRTRKLEAKSLQAPSSIEWLAQETVNVYLNNVRVISALSNEYSFKYACYWQPVLFNKKLLSTREKKLFEKSKFWKELYDAVGYKIKQQNNLEINDISGILSDIPEEIYIDPWHISENGNQIIAQRIASDILAKLA